MSVRSSARPSGRASIPTPPVKFADDDLSLANRSRSRAKQQRGWLSWLIALTSRLGICYVLFAALWSCPSRPFAFDYEVKDPRPVCKNIAQTYHQIAPAFHPYIDTARAKVEPYSTPVINAVTPFTRRAYKVSRPVFREATKRSKLVWKKRIDPARKRALKHADKRVQPYITRANSYYAQQMQPHVNAARKTVKPYQDMYHRDVAPYVDQAYQYSLQSSSVTYAFYMDRVHPQVVRLVKQMYSFLVNHVDPAVRRAYSLYVRPQVEKLLQKVYERKAHYLGSDAIKSAQSDMRSAARRVDKAAQSTILEAEREVIRAQNDPTVGDRLKQAKDAVTGGRGDNTDSIEIARLDAELEVEEAKVKEQLEVWEVGMTDLIEKEYRLTVERLAELRNRRLSDLPDRFGLLNEAFVEDQVALVLSRIDRGTRKLAAGLTDDNQSERLASAQTLVDRQLARFDDAAEDTKVQIAGFYDELLQQERQTVEASSQELRRYAQAAEQAYTKIMAEAKFSATLDDWEGWSTGVKKRALLFSEELYAMQQNKKNVRASSGAPDLRAEAPDVGKEIQHLRRHADLLHQSARKEVVAFGTSALAQLTGKGVLAKVSDVTDHISEQASQASISAVAGMMAAVDAARSRLGLSDSSNDGYVSRAKSFMSSSDSESVDSYAGSLAKGAESVMSSVSSVASQASHSVASAVGATPTAEGYVDALTDSVWSATESIASLASQVSKSAVSAVQAEPTPSGLTDYADSVTAKVEDLVDGAVEGAASASSYAASVLDQATRSAASVVAAESSKSSFGDYVDEALQQAASVSSAGFSAVHEATRSVASALGASPTPETFFDYVDSMTDGANSLASSASAMAASGSSYIASTASDASSAAGQSLSSASSAASSVASQASSSISSVLQSVASDARSSAVSANSQASSVVSKATRSAKSAVGASPSPETLEDYVEDVKDSISSAAQYVSGHTDSAFSAVSQATRSVKSAVGATPTPETFGDYVEDSKDTISSLVEDAVNAAGSASSAAASGIKKAAEQVHLEL